MRMIGNDVHIQRGETWSLDFAVRNAKGDPFMLFKEWQNPYIAITVTAALYEQIGDLRETYWLDLSDRWVEQVDGSMVLEPIKKFIATEALYLGAFEVDEAINNYGLSNGGDIVRDPNSDFYVGNYLFFIDPKDDGNRIYKYFDGYDDNDDEIWVDYDFRVIKAFDTREWIEQSYWYDIKLLAGESVDEHLARLLNIDVDDWTDEEMLELINSLPDENDRNEMLKYYESGVPLMADYDAKVLILEPTRIYVSANIQGDVK